MKTYVLRFRGRKTPHRVKANNLAEAKVKFIKGSLYTLNDAIWLKGETEKINK